MEFTEEWKSLWPISSTFSAPLFISNKGSDAPFGPLIFTPEPNSSATLLHSPSIAPCLPSPYPQLSLSRFLQRCHSVPSSTPSIASHIGPLLPDQSSHFHGFNALQMLQIPNKNLVILFFAEGENSDRVGVSLLSVKAGSLNGQKSQKENFFQVVKEGNMNHQRIICLLVNPVDDSFGYGNEDIKFGDSCSVNKRSNVVDTVGFLMACTNYSVNWYRVGISKDRRQHEYFVCLDYLGCADSKMLRGNAVAGACWSPHLREECIVLLENGDLLLFDVNYSSRRQHKSMFSVNTSVGKRIKVSLNDKVGLEEESGDKGPRWFGCEFSWHPRLCIIHHREEIFLVDMRSTGECSVCSLLKLETLSTHKNDGFFTLRRAGSDGFIFAVATRKLLLLCDVRKPLMPVLRWAHGIRNPRYITVFGLPELRANATETSYKLASESGHCIILGSFWDNEFSIFCYGPDINRNASVQSEISKFCNTYYAWGHPSEFSLSGSDCNCGSCIVSEELAKESLLAWIDWRQKKHLSLGFGILHPDLYAQVSLPKGFGGFILMRLTSSGKLEAQRYNAAWEMEKISLTGHKRKGVYSEDNLLYDCSPSEYDGKKQFQHLKLEYLNAYLKDKLGEVIVRRREYQMDCNQAAQIKHPVISQYNFHQEICPKLKDFGLSRERSSLAISDVMKDITLPTSIHNIALRSMYATLPTNLLQLAFSTYADFDEDSDHCQEALEFLGIPEQSQLLPCPSRKTSNRSNRWSSKIQPTNDTLVGPIMPAQVLATLHKIYAEELQAGTKPYREESEAFSAHSHFKIQCNKIMDVVQEQVSGSAAKAEDDDFISLADDKDDTRCASQKLKLSYHRPSAFLDHTLSVDSLKGECYEFSTHVLRRNQDCVSDVGAEIVGMEIFDAGCPVELKFNDPSIDFSPRELEAFKKLKKQELNFRKSFKPYQDYINK